MRLKAFGNTTAVLALVLGSLFAASCGSGASDRAEKKPGVDEGSSPVLPLPLAAKPEPGALAGTWKGPIATSNSLSDGGELFSVSTFLTFEDSSATFVFKCDVGVLHKTVELRIAAAYTDRAFYFLQDVHKSEKIGDYTCGGKVSKGYATFAFDGTTAIVSLADGKTLLLTR